MILPIFTLVGPYMAWVEYMHWLKNVGKPTKPIRQKKGDSALEMDEIFEEIKKDMGEKND